MRVFVVALLLLAAAPLRAMIVEYDPPVGDTHTAVSVSIHDVAGAPIHVDVTSVDIVGHSITIHTHVSGGFVSVVAPWLTTTRLPLLAGGVYNLAIDFDGGSAQPLSPPLIIRERDKVVPTNTALPSSGGMNAFSIARRAGNDFIDSISIDGGGTWISLLRDGETPMPPHAPGTVDVLAKDAHGSVLTAAAAMTYVDAAAPPDLALYEPLLFPVSFQGTDGHGMQWTTENLLQYSVYRGAEPQKLTGNPAGDIVWVMRDGTTYDAACRLTSLTSGVVSPLPVLREKDLVTPARGGSTHFLHVPNPQNSIVVLRVWLFAHVPKAWATVRASGMSSGYTYLELTASGDGLPLFGTMDLTQSFQRAGSWVDVSIDQLTLDDAYDAHLWFLLTITDKDTGRVTVVPL